MIQRLKTWWATALVWWRTRFRKQAARVAALEGTVRKMSDVVLTKQIVTRLVTLVDKKGQARVTLAVEDDGTAALMFVDEDCHARIDISLKDGKPEICIYDADGMTTRAERTLQDDRATMKVCGAGSAQMVLAARNETVAAIATDKDGTLRGILSSSAYSCLVLLEAEGKPVFTAPPDGDSGQGDGLDLKKVFGF